MNDAAMETGSDDVGRWTSRAAAGAQGVVHTFVEMSELRRIMGRLAAIEILRLMMMDADTPAT